MFAMWNNSDNSNSALIKQLLQKIKELTDQLDTIQLIVKNYTNN